MSAPTGNDWCGRSAAGVAFRGAKRVVLRGLQWQEEHTWCSGFPLAKGSWGGRGVSWTKAGEGGVGDGFGSIRFSPAFR